MGKAVHCDKCSGEIELRDDLVTSTIFFTVVPYHEECYAKDLKGAKTFILSNQPMNGFAGNFTAVIAFLLGVGLPFIPDGSAKAGAIFCFVVVLYRLYSYFSYERHLEK